MKKLANRENELMNLIENRTQVFKMNTHDLKNPLSSIFSLSGIPVSSFKDSEEITQTLNVIHDASKIMMTLVNENLEYFSISTGSMKFENTFVDIVGLINQIVEINRPLAKDKNQQIIFTYSEKDCFIYSDNNKIYRAINNIVSNAIKFSPFGKSIWIEVSKNIETNKIVIVIKDEGPGFKKEEVANVFVKFGKYFATPTGNEISTGLGLLIANQIINHSNGEIKLESEEGKGATFIIEFPSIALDS
jgi:signal transduction histidine kinase